MSDPNPEDPSYWQVPAWVQRLLTPFVWFGNLPSVSWLWGKLQRSETGR